MKITAARHDPRHIFDIHRHHAVMLRRRATAVHTCCMPQAMLPSTAAADHGAAHGCRTDHESDAHAPDQVTHEGTEGEQSGQCDHKPRPPHDALADASERTLSTQAAHECMHQAAPDGPSRA